jgi:hypothetical protein
MAKAVARAAAAAVPVHVLLMMLLLELAYWRLAPTFRQTFAFDKGSKDILLIAGGQNSLILFKKAIRCRVKKEFS